MSELSLGTRLQNLKFVSSAVLEILAFNAPKLRGHVTVTVTTPTFRKYLSGVMSGLFMGTRLPNLKFISLAVLELLAFNAQKFMGSRDHDHAHFLEKYVRVMSGLSLGARLPNLKFVSLAVSELLAFNSQKITGSRDSGHAHFYPIFTFRGWRPPRHVV